MGELLRSLCNARSLLKRHLDDLFGASLAADVDLPNVLSPLQEADGTLAEQDLVDALCAAGVDTGALDIEEVLQALDSRCQRRILVSEVLQGYAEFRARHGSILRELADRIGT